MSNKYRRIYNIKRDVELLLRRIQEDVFRYAEDHSSSDKEEREMVEQALITLKRKFMKIHKEVSMPRKGSTHSTLSLKVSKDEYELIRKVIYRAGITCPQALIALEMDLIAAKANNPISLKKLLASSDTDFYYDIAGIQRKLNRCTGKIKGFTPACYIETEGTEGTKGNEGERKSSIVKRD